MQRYRLSILLLTLLLPRPLYALARSAAHLLRGGGRGIWWRGRGGMHLKCGGARGGGGWELRVRVSVMDALRNATVPSSFLPVRLQPARMVGDGCAICAIATGNAAAALRPSASAASRSGRSGGGGAEGWSAHTKAVVYPALLCCNFCKNNRKLVTFSSATVRTPQPLALDSV